MLTVAPPDARGHRDTVRDSGSGCSATVRESRIVSHLPSPITVAPIRCFREHYRSPEQRDNGRRANGTLQHRAASGAIRSSRPYKAMQRRTRSLYRRWLGGQPKLLAALPDLRGRDLVCWCAPLPSHGDVLLELANKQ